MNEEKQKMIVIVGPTSSGKSELAVEIARTFDGEVVSADSRQVYRGLNLGTGKITKREMHTIPHHLLDVADPQDTFTAQDFKRLGREAVSDILTRGKLPIVAGGTGFYIAALVDGIALPEVPPNHELRKRLAHEPLESLVAMLRDLDPVRLSTVEQKNPRRLIRAIEIATALGHVPKSIPDQRYDSLFIGIEVEKKKLQQKIEKRIRARIDQGMLNEAVELHKTGLTYNRMEDLGLEYRYMARFLQGLLTKEEMITELMTKSIQYAKRQMTWFKRDERITWIKASEHDTVFDIVSVFLQNI